jgi:undecaprenyl-diphosphatase
VRAAGRRAQGPARFLWERLTPGDLGLELTTLLATAFVGAFVFFGYLIALGPGELTPGDGRGRVWSDALRTGILDDAAGVVRHLGELPVAAIAVALVAAGLFAARERLEAAVLVGGMALTAVAALLADGAIDRGGPTYPDTAAAYAVAWTAIAVALRRVTGTVARTAPLVAIGLVLSAAVALTSVYRGEDLFSDVAGGLGLGVLCFSVAGVAGLLIHER